MDIAVSFSNRRQNSPNQERDYLGHRTPSVDHNFIIDRQIGTSFCQNLYLYDGLVPAPAQVSKHCLGDRSGELRSVIMVGVWLGFRIFGIIRFESGFRYVDQGDHSQHTFDAFGRRGNTYGAYQWPDF